MMLCSCDLILSDFSGQPYNYCGIYLDLRVTVSEVHSYYFIVRYPRLEHTGTYTASHRLADDVNPFS